ncbi:hypothetical protein JCM30760_11740 [Thiomicrorhabdus hydrogeniphila]
MKTSIILGLMSSLLLSSCAAPRGGMGGGGHGGGGNADGLILLGAGVVIGSIIATLPKKHAPAGPDQYYSDGVFYRNSPNGYQVIAAPIGVRVNQIPANHRVVRYEHRIYYNARGSWYIYDHHLQQYQVVAPPERMNPR